MVCVCSCVVVLPALQAGATVTVLVRTQVAQFGLLDALQVRTRDVGGSVGVVEVVGSVVEATHSRTTTAFVSFFGGLPFASTAQQLDDSTHGVRHQAVAVGRGVTARDEVKGRKDNKEGQGHENQ